MNPNETGGVIAPHAAASFGSVGQLSTGGSVGQRLLASGFDVSSLRPCADAGDGLNVNTTLIYDEWKFFDNVVQQVSRENLPAVQDIIARGLVMNIPNALGVMDIQWERVKGDLISAEITMSGLNEATKDRLEWEQVNMPLPIIHKEFFYNLRHLEAARRHGRQLDASHAAVATRKVSELIESLLFNGVTIAGSTIYGLATEPNRKTLSVTADWRTATGTAIVSDIIRMVDTATNVGNNFHGPFILYVSQSVGAHFGDDYKTNSDKTILQRIMEIPGIQKIIWTSRLAGSTALLVQPTSDVVEMVNGMAPTMVEWDSHGGFQQNFKVMAIMIPRVRSDGWQQSGIVQIA